MGEAEEDEEGLALHLGFGDRLAVLIDTSERSAHQRGGVGDGLPGRHHPKHRDGNHHEASDEEGQAEDWSTKPHVWSLPFAQT
jgi:hypothetical protein